MNLLSHQFQMLSLHFARLFPFNIQFNFVT
jgi:hypothetical protein